YWDFDGLNLTLEKLDGLVKQNGPLDLERHPLVALAVTEAGIGGQIALDLLGSAEAQAAAVADDIAFNNHDIDDALRARFLDFGALADVPLAGRFVRDVLARDRQADWRRAFYEVNRRMITAMIEDVLAASRRRIASMADKTPDGVAHRTGPVITFSDAMAAELSALRKFLFAEVYRNERLMRPMRNAEVIVRNLYKRYVRAPHDLPGERSTTLAALPEDVRERAIGDFIAGMTDRFAVAEHRRLFDDTPDLV
ncbi:MAG: deoxyguanosinetriphosphate triphosphohydrolase, partial [Hyphomicrobiaceae bacterium]